MFSSKKQITDSTALQSLSCIAPSEKEPAARHSTKSTFANRLCGGWQFAELPSSSCGTTVWECCAGSRFSGWSKVSKMSCGQTVERWNLEPSRWMRTFALSFATERCATPAGMSAACVRKLINNYTTPSKRSFFQALAIRAQSLAIPPQCSAPLWCRTTTLQVCKACLSNCHARKVQAVQPCRCNRAHLGDLSHHVVNLRRSYEGTNRSTKVTKGAL